MKPSAPPPPPRRHSSGIRNPDPIDEPQPPTENFGSAYGEPPTMAAARARIHEIARELPSENRFNNHNPRYNDETQGRIEPADLAAAHAAYDRQFSPPSEDAYDRLPAIGRPDSYDSAYPAQEPYPSQDPYPAQDPMTALRPAYDEALQRHGDRYGERPLPEDDSSGEYARRERRNSPVPAYSTSSGSSFDAAAYEANYPKGRREEPSYADRRPSYRGDEKKADPGSDRRNRDDRRDEGKSFRRDDFPREGSYRDEPRREDNKSFRRDEPRREDNKSYRAPEQRSDETRAEGSSAKHDNKRGPSGDSSWGTGNEPSIPGPARVPAELRVPENFVVGVQPIRTPSMGAAAFPPPQAVITPAYGQGPMTAAASPAAMNMGMPLMPPITMPPMMAPMTPMGGNSVINQMHVRAHTSARPPTHIAQPTEFEEAQQGSKVGRFAWFVFGAAFGIFFAFAATGFGFGKKDEAPSNFPPAPTAPVQTQVPVAQPPVAQPPMQPVLQQPIVQPVVQQPIAQPPGVPQLVAQPGMAPVAPAPPPGVIAAPNQTFAPIVPAPQPQQPVAQTPPGGRPAPPPAAGNQGTVRVRGAGGGGAARRPSGGRAPAAQNNDDEAPPPPRRSSSQGEPNAADLLGDGLR